ncbi:hypothetical protein KSP39_PZI013643 [Platanthera zijinensis]|uniref:Acid phosphatase/vanadium-dependent haloperoxidase-related protein n=1 Tax=Platanthera zijinensis TaxID=2320716 RepID=A0AAP0BD73_9ASPA
MFSASLSGAFLHSPLSSKKKKKPILPSTRGPLPAVAAFKIEMDEIAELARNKVLVACTLSWAIGQLSKSFTSPVRGNGFDWKAAVRSGGMPSTHSASVAAAATSVGLERGFSDPIFGMSVIFAALVMYDAQGVRREVGYHAKVINELLKARDLETKSEASIKPGKVVSVLSGAEKGNTFVEKETKIYSLVNAKEESEKFPLGEIHLNESVGHTEIQVLAGAFLGFIVSLMVNAAIT